MSNETNPSTTTVGEPPNASVKTLEYPKLEMPQTVVRKAVTIWSNGVALDGDIYRPKALVDDQRAPAVVMSHGLGGSKLSAERYAAKFANAGIVVLCFSHAGWAGSGSHLIQIGDTLQLDDKNEGVAKVRGIRQLVDPLEWIQSFRSAVDYIEGEPNVDIDRIGAWGTSYGGGIAMHNAANDRRIKGLVVQVAYVSGIRTHLVALARQRAIDIARGKIPFVPLGLDFFPSTPGTPHWAKSLQYNALEEIPKLDIPTLMLDAGNEELFDIKENCGSAYKILKKKGTSPVRYIVIDGIDHYGIYFDGFEESSEAALEWFVKYLLPIKLL